jgi:hypothetical protein
MLVAQYSDTTTVALPFSFDVHISSTELKSDFLPLTSLILSLTLRRVPVLPG